MHITLVLYSFPNKYVKMLEIKTLFRQFWLLKQKGARRATLKIETRTLSCDLSTLYANVYIILLLM